MALLIWNILLFNTVHGPTSQWYSNIALSVVFADSSFQHTFQSLKIAIVKKKKRNSKRQVIYQANKE